MEATTWPPIDGPTFARLTVDHSEIVCLGTIRERTCGIGGPLHEMANGAPFYGVSDHGRRRDERTSVCNWLRVFTLQQLATGP
jgi:hypothetical protein